MRKRYNIIYGLVVLGLLFVLGCSKSNSVTAPSDSVITINPSEVTASIAGDTKYVFSITVKDADSNPVNRAEIFIYGSFAAPRTPTRYQFYKDINATVSTNSGFNGETDGSGTYSFSIIVPGTVGGATNAFIDNIEVSSGTAFESVSISVNQE